MSEGQDKKAGGSEPGRIEVSGADARQTHGGRTDETWTEANGTEADASKATGTDADGAAVDWSKATGVSAPPSDRPRILGLTAQQLRETPALRGLPKYRSQQLATWIFARGALTFDEMTDLPLGLRKKLTREFDISRDPVVARTEDPAGEATKYLFQLHDLGFIESVIIRGRRRQTFCISSQVGCAYGCTFCATARMGPGRNLTAAEIVSQAMVLRDALQDFGWAEGFNLVFMGMGEPLANLENLVQSLRILQDPWGMAIGRRRITVSTVGLPHKIRQLAEEPVAPRLAFSLVATTHAARAELMPVEKKYPFTEVLEALREYQERTGQRVTLEYVLMKGVNDSTEDAKRLARFARDADAKVNIIAFNPHPNCEHEPSTPDRMAPFLETLYPLASAVTVRHSRGQRIQAACGQLATNVHNRPPRKDP